MPKKVVIPNFLLIGSVCYMNSEKCEFFWANSYDSEVGQGNAGLDPIHSVTRERSHDFPSGHVPVKLSGGGSGEVSWETPAPLFKLVIGQFISL